MKTKKEKQISFIISVLAVIFAVVFFFGNRGDDRYSVPEVPAYNNEAYCVINDNNPTFTENELTTEAYEYYSALDSYGRCGYAMACVGIELMPTEDRESISSVKPSGWNQKQYDFVDGESLYNRCHLIGFQLTGENANERNLITGTRYMNVQGMLPFENMIADYVKETENHVLYRVIPDFHENELVARGVQMEAYSVEDNGDGICFNVYAYNIQPGVVLDYEDGSSYAEGQNQSVPTGDSQLSQDYILNVKSKKFHLADCRQVHSIQEENRETYSGDRNTLIERSYEPAGCCNP